MGRTGRIGKKGTAISLVSGAEIVTLSALQQRFGIEFEQRKLPTPDEAKTAWVEKHTRELREAMTGGMAYDAFLSLAADLSNRDDGRSLLAYALKYFFTHHRMEKAQARAAGEKLLESHKVEQVHREQKKARGEHDRSRRKPRLERVKETADERAEGKTVPRVEPVADTPSERAESPLAPVDRVKLFVSPGADDGWEKESYASALSALAGQPRESILAVDLKGRYAYVLVRPGSEQAYLAAAGRSLKDKPITIEIARPRKR